MAEHKTLAEALAAFQAELPKVTKGETAKVTGESKSGAKISYTYGYAGLDTVVEAVLPVLGKHGLSITSKSTYADGNFMLEVSLLHESGERETGYWPLPDPRRVGPQDLGSAYTYGRRYLTLALTGTFPGGEDDDGAKAQQAPRDSWDTAQPAQRRPAPDRQAQAGEEPQAAPATPAPEKTTWTDDEVLRLVKPMPTAEVTKALSVYDWMAAKDLHRRIVSMDYEGAPVKVTATDLIAGRLADEAQMEDVTVRRVATVRAFAEDRGLLKVQVSDTETLDQVLYEALELAQYAEAESNPPSSAGSENG